MFGSVAFWLVIERRDKLLRLFMADWHVSGSESEEEGVGDDGMEVGNLRIPVHRVAELLRTIETRKTLDLECLAGSSGKTTARRRRRKRHKRKGGSPSAADDSITQEEVSETASEQRSSASTDTRDEKRDSVSHFDYFHEDSASSEVVPHRRQRKLPPGNRERKLASLDQIVADVRQHRDKHQHQHEEEGDFSTTPEITLPYHQPHFIMHHSHQTHNSTHGLSSKGATPVSASSSTTAAPLFDFDDGSDLDSPTGAGSMGTSVLSQINRIEKLLDDEGLT